MRKKIIKLGSGEIISVDVKIIAATNRDIQILVKENKFRLDLFFRLNTIMLKIPPLRERKEDILPLIQGFLDGAGSEKKTIKDDIKKFLFDYKWYGNI